jgi:tetratricopeptide (TPR) repeat protein
MRAVAATILAVVLITVAAPAQANDRRAAAAAFQRGRGLYDAGQFADALAAFQEGYRLYPLPGFLVNIGQCQRKLEQLDDAQDSFQHYLASDTTDTRTRAEVRDALDEIAAERARRAAAEAPPASHEAPASAPTPAVAAPAQETRPDLRAHAEPAPAAAPAVAASAPPVEVTAVSNEPPKKKSKKWVWAIVGVLAAGAAASAITVGILESQPAPPRPGSLGLLDGRR